ncbi:hypothetical protein V6N13_080538 [Hibiscus sabdariffa]
MRLEGMGMSWMPSSQGNRTVEVWRLGGKSVLLSIEDEDLFLMLEDLNFSYLKEIFTEVIFWSESFVQRDRSTWLEVSGLPLHCWNHTTLKRIAEIWGTFEALGENAHHTLDCEKVSVLITTKHAEKINEVIEVGVRSKVFRVRVLEIGFKDDTRSITTMKNGKEVVNQNVYHHAEPSSEQSRSGSPERIVNRLPTEDFNAMFFGKEEREECFYEAINLNLGERDLKGCELTKGNDRGRSLGNPAEVRSPGLKEDVKPNNVAHCKVISSNSLGAEQAVEDMMAFGVVSNNVVTSPEDPLIFQAGKSAWEALVDEQNNVERNFGFGKSAPIIIEDVSSVSLGVVVLSFLCITGHVCPSLAVGKVYMAFDLDLWR